MFEKVKEVILDTLSCEPEQITMEASLVDDLEADSLDAVELNLAAERRAGLLPHRRGAEEHRHCGRYRPSAGGASVSHGSE